MAKKIDRYWLKFNIEELKKGLETFKKNFEGSNWNIKDILIKNGDQLIELTFDEFLTKLGLK